MNSVLKANRRQFIERQIWQHGKITWDIKLLLKEWFTLFGDEG